MTDQLVYPQFGFVFFLSFSLRVCVVTRHAHSPVGHFDNDQPTLSIASRPCGEVLTSQATLPTPAAASVCQDKQTLYRYAACCIPKLQRQATAANNWRVARDLPDCDASRTRRTKDSGSAPAATQPGCLGDWAKITRWRVARMAGQCENDAVLSDPGADGHSARVQLMRQEQEGTGFVQSTRCWFIFRYETANHMTISIRDTTVRVVISPMPPTKPRV